MQAIAATFGPQTRRVGIGLLFATVGLLQGCASETASALPASTAIATRIPAPTSTPLATVGPAPAGPWTSITWIDAGRAFPQFRTTGNDALEVAVHGWSGGFVGFASGGGPWSGSSQPATLVATSSADGLRWSTPRALDRAGLDDRIAIVAMVEGPAGLLAVGDYSSGTCGGPPTVAGLWSSVDGSSWHRVRVPKSFSSARVETVDAGSAGYIASGTLSDGTTPAVWLSRDGDSWSAMPLLRSIFGKVVASGATSFESGFVIAGALLGRDGCGGASHLTPSLWWSASGTQWSRSPLPDASAASDVYMTVSRIDDRALVAIANESNTSTGADARQVWVTRNGRTWTAVSSPSSLISSTILTDERRGLLVVDAPGNAGPPTIAAVADDLTVTELPQSGKGPIASDATSGWLSALGPTGVVIVSTDTAQLWLGVPSGS
ncbi:MAG TPA: hypothetical protein VE640_06430 [Candidatus Bathyarchaeia archaeon]|nr:hypothetical protein [Candidatus Bathyarchaeia archaeon]